VAGKSLGQANVLGETHAESPQVDGAAGWVPRRQRQSETKGGERRRRETLDLGPRRLLVEARGKGPQAGLRGEPVSPRAVHVDPKRRRCRGAESRSDPIDPRGILDERPAVGGRESRKEGRKTGQFSRKVERVSRLREGLARSAHAFGGARSGRARIAYEAERGGASFADRGGELDGRAVLGQAGIRRAAS
jgi:hypothetical protein